MKRFFTAVVISWLFSLLAACGSDEIVDPPPPGPHDFVQWEVTGDLESSGQGDYAHMELYSAGEQSQAILVLQVNGSTTLTLRSPRGLVHLQKTVYEVHESGGGWSGEMAFFDAMSREDFLCESGYLTASEVSEDRVDGDFQIRAHELDSQGQPVSSGRRIRVNGRFSAHILHTHP